MASVIKIHDIESEKYIHCCLNILECCSRPWDVYIYIYSSGVEHALKITVLRSNGMNQMSVYYKKAMPTALDMKIYLTAWWVGGLIWRPMHAKGRLGEYK